MKRTTSLAVITGTLLLASASAARADAGTPLIWASTFHLFIGNFVIGLVEAGLLAWRYKRSSSFTYFMMILANYASAWAGYFVAFYVFNNIMQYATSDKSLPLHAHLIPEFFMLAVLFLITIIVEWPFCYFSLRGGSAQQKSGVALRSLKASIFLQSVTCSAILIIYVWLRIVESGW